MRQGFTLIELLVVLAIFLLVGLLSLSSLAQYRDVQALETGVETIRTAVSEARSKAIASEGGSQYGIYLNTDRVVVFPGTSFSEPNSSNVEFSLEPSISISTTSLSSGTSTVVFSKFIGEAAQYGTITVSLVRDQTKFKTIEVSKTGAVSIK